MTTFQKIFINNTSMGGALEVPNIHPEFIVSTGPLVGLLTAREGSFFDRFALQMYVAETDHTI